MQYVRALARSWFIVILTLVAGGAGGFWVYHSTTPLYRSSVRMIVSGSGGGKNQDEVTSRILATQRALALAQVAGTAPALKAAASAAGYPGASPAVTAASDANGPFVTVTVDDTNPRRAQAVANAFAGILPRTLFDLEGRTETSLAVKNLAPATLPAEPFSPNLNRDLGLGLAGGLVLGLAIALLREVVDRTVRDSEDLERLTDLTVLGTVPRDLPKKPMPAVTNPRSARAEAYRQIRTTLLNAETAPRMIAVTSATVGEGKTSVATNLAAVFSRAGHSVVIVDADLRRPRVATVFGTPPRPGLSDVLARRVSLDDALTVMDDGRLAVLPSGTIPANPSEALGGDGMAEVLQQLAGSFEYVFVDTPPVLPVTDALVVAPLVDGVVLVTRLGRTTRERVRRAEAGIRRVNAGLLGVVPNHAGKGADRDYRYGYKYSGSHKKDGAPSEISAELFHPGATHGHVPAGQSEVPEPAEAVPVPTEFPNGGSPAVAPEPTPVEQPDDGRTSFRASPLEQALAKAEVPPAAVADLPAADGPPVLPSAGSRRAPRGGGNSGSGGRRRSNGRGKGSARRHSGR